MAALLLAEHRDGDRDGDVRVQRDLDREVPHLLERPLRHAHVGALDLVALGLQRLDDVVVRDRAEEAPIGARLLRDLQREPLEIIFLDSRVREARKKRRYWS